MSRRKGRTIRIINRQRALDLDTGVYQSFAETAAEQALDPKSLEEINIVIVSDKKISELHWQFMGIGGPTDVISFLHGEIVISAETAKRQAEEFGATVEEELKLYIIHGLLHLAGHEDQTEAGRAEMERLQQEIFASIKSAGDRT